MPIKSAREYNWYASLQAAHRAAEESRRAAEPYIDPDNQFDFFNLPQELRNIVYDELMIESEHEIPQDVNGEITVKAYNAPRLQDLLVGRQFLARRLRLRR